MRGLVRRAGFSLTIILVAAMGIGATTAVFSLIDRIFLRPLPYAHQERFVSVGITLPLDSNEFFFPAQYFELRKFAGPFDSVTAFQAGTLSCELSEENPARELCLRVEANFLDTFGVAPSTGRMFSRAEDVPGGPRVAVISYGLWRSRFAGDPSVAGKTISLDGLPATIVGVLPKNFETPTLAPGDILVPLQLNEAGEPGNRALRGFARLAPGISIAEARAALDPYFEHVQANVPAPMRKQVGLAVRSVRDRQVGDARFTAYALFASVLALLLIACANIANMLIARGVSRRGELAVRAALGASRWRLIRQTLSESLALGAIGGILGCALAYGLVRFFVALAPAGLPRVTEVSIDVRVLEFAVVVSLAAALSFGFLPALAIPRNLATTATKATPRLRGGLRTVLVTAQIAISLVLLNASALLLKSLQNIESVPLGIQPAHVVMARLELGRVRYAQAGAQATFFSRLEQQLASMRGVESYAVADTVPPAGAMNARPLSTIHVEASTPPESAGSEMVGFRYITPGYFSALGIPLLRGRAFDESDRSADAYSVVISEMLARRLFPNEDPIGRRILRDEPMPWFTVIGVVADVKNNGPQDPGSPEFYQARKSAPAAGVQAQRGRVAVAIIRANGDARAVASQMREAIQGIDPAVAATIETMEARLDGINQRPRFDALLLGAFAVTGTALAAVGLFGVMLFLVAQGTREIGVRVALGAAPAEILRWSLGHAARWVAVGISLGLAGALGSARYLRSLLFQVGPADIRALLIAVVLLCVVALLAAAIPARRAMLVDPIVALRHE